jgi:hypothetical protein
MLFDLVTTDIKWTFSNLFTVEIQEGINMWQV